jgi:hypothetical protein
MDLTEMEVLLIGEQMFSHIFGNVGATGLSAQQVANSPGPWYYQQQAMAAQQQAAQNMSQGTYQGGNWQTPKWMFNGVMMSVLEMANTIWPEDCADKTAFVLKYSE